MSAKGVYLRPPWRLDLVGPVVFLAGPIQGAPLWQPHAAEIIQSADPSVNVCSPRRDERNDREFTDEKYYDQVNWETEYLQRAGENGVVLFWLPCVESEVPGRSYAQTSRFELGNQQEKARRGDIKLVIGAEQDFPNRRYIYYRTSSECPNAALCETLEETLAAVRLAQSS